MPAQSGLVANGPTPGTSALKRIIHQAIRQALPLPAYWRFLAWRLGPFDVELALLDRLCDRSRLSIDVGASNGDYTVHLLRHSRKCYAFEPRREAATALATRLVNGSHDRLTIEAAAVSDHDGQTRLRVLLDETGRSTLESENPIEDLGRVREVAVPTVRLDDYPWCGPAGFIKIDVEGHEDAVLRGAHDLLVRDGPALLVEAEERHKPGAVVSIREFLAELGYRGFWFRDERLHPIEGFDAERHQDPTNIAGNINRDNLYINNFVFVNDRGLERVADLLAD